MKQNEYDPIKPEVWNEIKRKYPDAWNIFSDWIDEYKKAINWDRLFRNGIGTELPHRGDIKFHDLPHAFQLGIWIHFVWDQGGCSWEIDDMFEFDLEEEMRHWFSSKQLEFDKHGNDL